MEDTVPSKFWRVYGRSACQERALGGNGLGRQGWPPSAACLIPGGIQMALDTQVWSRMLSWLHRWWQGWGREDALQLRHSGMAPLPRSLQDHRGRGEACGGWGHGGKHTSPSLRGSGPI